MKIVDQDHPFYRPLWRRLVIVGLIAAWAAYEIGVVRDPLWMILIGGLLAYAVWNFLITWPKPGPTDDGK
jgi:hypothetical protein